MTASQPPQPPPGGQEPEHGQQPGYGHPAPGQLPHGQQPPPGYGQAPPPGYGQPPPGYGQAPPPGYGQVPPPGYGQVPPPGYAQPGYGPPPGAPSTYGQPSGGAPSVGFDPKKLRMADYVIAGGTLLFLILSFFTWYDLGDGEFFGVDFAVSGWAGSGTVKLAFFLFLLATVWTLLPAFYDVEVGFPRSWITVGLAALGFLLTLFAWFDTFDFEFSLWALLGFLTAAAILVFAVLRLLPELRNRPSLPGGLAGAAQWADQQAPEFGHRSGAPQQPGYGVPSQTHDVPPQAHGAPPAAPPPPPPGGSTATGEGPATDRPGTA